LRSADGVLEPDWARTGVGTHRLANKRAANKRQANKTGIGPIHLNVLPNPR